MRVFVTGATGWIGSAVVKELLSSGHEVTGLTTTRDGARKLQAPAPKARGSWEGFKTMPCCARAPPSRTG